LGELHAKEEDDHYYEEDLDSGDKGCSVPMVFVLINAVERY
jgi:hypothetical protein